MISKTIKQSQLTSDCWSIQIWGMEACEDCGLLGTDECDGQEIREALLAGEDHEPVSIDDLLIRV